MQRTYTASALILGLVACGAGLARPPEVFAAQEDDRVGYYTSGTLIVEQLGSRTTWRVVVAPRLPEAGGGMFTVVDNKLLSARVTFKLEGAWEGIVPESRLDIRLNLETGAYDIEQLIIEGAPGAAEVRYKPPAPVYPATCALHEFHTEPSGAMRGSGQCEDSERLVTTFQFDVKPAPRSPKR